MAGRHVEEALPRGQPHGQPGRVVGARLAVEKLGLLSLEQALELSHVEAVLVHRHRQELGPEGAEHLHRPRIGRPLDGHEVSRIEEGARHEIEALLRAIDDEDLFRPRLHPEAKQIAGQVLAQRRIAGRRVVLEQLPPLRADHRVEHPAEGVGGKQRAIRHAPRERDEPRRRPGDIRVRLTAHVGPDHLRPLRQEAGPVQPRQRDRRRGRPLREPVGHEGPLPDMRPGPARRHQLLVRRRHRGPVHAQLGGKLSRRRKLDAGREQSLGDEALDMALDLARQRQPALASRAPIQRDLHEVTISHFAHNKAHVKGQLDESPAIQ
jgi:hypothetical protein